MRLSALLILFALGVPGPQCLFPLRRSRGKTVFTHKRFQVFFRSVVPDFPKSSGFPPPFAESFSVSWAASAPFFSLADLLDIVCQIGFLPSTLRELIVPWGQLCFFRLF